MAAPALNIGNEVTPGTAVTPDRAYDFTSEAIQAQQVRVEVPYLRGGQVSQSSGSSLLIDTFPNGPVTMPVRSRGMGRIYDWMLGSSTHTLVSGSTYQGVHKLSAATPTKTVQVVRQQIQTNGSWGSVPFTYAGMVVTGFEIEMSNRGILNLSFTIDGKSITTATAEAAQTYPGTPNNVFTFVGACIFQGTVPEPTTTAMVDTSGLTALANVLSAKVSSTSDLSTDRSFFCNAGKKSPAVLVGFRAVDLECVVEFVQGGPFVDAILANTQMGIVLNFTGAALSAGTEHVQVILRDVRFTGDMPVVSGLGIIQHTVKGAAYEIPGSSALIIATRTADTAL